MTELKYKQYASHCWWCGCSAEACGGLQEHHIYRGVNRRTSPTRWLCQRCHEAVTANKDDDILMRRAYEQEVENQTYD